MARSKEELSQIVAISKNYSQVLRNLGLPITGSSHRHIKKSICRYEIDTSHFQNTTKGIVSLNKKTASEILVFNENIDRRAEPKQLRRALIESGVEYKCSCCNNPGVWLDKIIKLEIDHIDGNWKNNQIENLRFLCPNCHSQIK